MAPRPRTSRRTASAPASSGTCARRWCPRRRCRGPLDPGAQLLQRRQVGALREPRQRVARVGGEIERDVRRLAERRTREQAALQEIGEAGAQRVGFCCRGRAPRIPPRRSRDRNSRRPCHPSPRSRNWRRLVASSSRKVGRYSSRTSLLSSSAAIGCDAPFTSTTPRSGTAEPFHCGVSAAAELRLLEQAEIRDAGLRPMDGAGRTPAGAACVPLRSAPARPPDNRMSPPWPRANRVTGRSRRDRGRAATRVACREVSHLACMRRHRSAPSAYDPRQAKAAGWHPSSVHGRAVPA